MTELVPPGPPSPFEPDNRHAVLWLSDYVYGTISTLVAIAGLTFETHPEALTSAGVVVFGALAIWLAHTLSRLVTTRSWQHLTLKRSDVRAQLLGSWSILAAAIPATVIFTLSGLDLWEVKTAFILAEVVGVLGLAVVGIGTAGGRERPLCASDPLCRRPRHGGSHDRRPRVGGARALEIRPADQAATGGGRSLRWPLWGGHSSRPFSWVVGPPRAQGWMWSA